MEKNVNLEKVRVCVWIERDYWKLFQSLVGKRRASPYLRDQVVKLLIQKGKL